MRFVQRWYDRLNDRERLRIGCHCGRGLVVSPPKTGTEEIVCLDCGLKYTINYMGEIFCHKCEEDFDKERARTADERNKKFFESVGIEVDTNEKKYRCWKTGTDICDDPVPDHYICDNECKKV